MSLQEGEGAAGKRPADPSFHWRLLNAILRLVSGPIPVDPVTLRPSSARAQHNSELSSHSWLDVFCQHAAALDAADEASVIKMLHTLR